MHFLNFFLFSLVIFALLYPDPDSESGSTDLIESGSNPDPNPKHCFIVTVRGKLTQILPVGRISVLCLDGKRLPEEHEKAESDAGHGHQHQHRPHRHRVALQARQSTPHPNPQVVN
jgi:hypothetical protein